MSDPIENIRAERIAKVKKIRDLGFNPYPASFDADRVIVGEARNKPLEAEVKVAGRLMHLRGHGKIVFADLRDQTGDIQLCFREDKLEEKWWQLLKFLDAGDFLGVAGSLFNTKSGELTILVDSFSLLTKSIRPLPSEWYGLKDTEARYRQRYLDLLLNPEVRQRFEARGKLVKTIRGFLDSQGYVEVETPTLQALYGGANAKPFKTHLNSLDCDYYLRIADELYLKRLVVGGFERVYEICKDFRNEGMDLAHNPEFTMIEWYEAYADYQRIMEMTEELFKQICESVYGKLSMPVGDKVVDLSKKWQRVTMVELIKEMLGIDVLKGSTAELVAFLKKNGIEEDSKTPKGQMIFDIFEHLLTDKLVEPTWVIDYPKEVSPLAKDHREKEGFVERFEGYIGGREIADGWSELTDPQVQRERFEADQKSGKEDAQPVDEDFLKAMEYGMPPLGGIGIGIDRLTMFFTNTWSIKEVILFPTMRPEGPMQSAKIKSQSLV